ncbi:hypothetical protein CEXT_474751 [Caerostris extrusa]|uniref:Uncharacterized protein n=1 Tax=Caerostris extrusa TaxID=172846 RepID=A0AAV4TEL4_CAEEX|nr:hypothetical protein CEXT_474751 [Caerostris extrusa]
MLAIHRSTCLHQCLFQGWNSGRLSKQRARFAACSVCDAAALRECFICGLGYGDDLTSLVVFQARFPGSENPLAVHSRAESQLKNSDCCPEPTPESKDNIIKFE